MKHTPGPWTSEENEIWASDRLLGYCCNDSQGEINARLIAQAPAMLEALQDMMDFIVVGAIPTKKAITRAGEAIRQATEGELGLENQPGSIGEVDEEA